MLAAPAPVKPHLHGGIIAECSWCYQNATRIILSGDTIYFCNLDQESFHRNPPVASTHASVAGLLPLIFKGVWVEHLALVTELLAAGRDRGGNVRPVDRPRGYGLGLRLTRYRRRRLGGGVGPLPRRNRTRWKRRRRYRIGSGRRGWNRRRDLGRSDRNDQRTGRRGRRRISGTFDGSAVRRRPVFLVAGFLHFAVHAPAIAGRIGRTRQHGEQHHGDGKAHRLLRRPSSFTGAMRPY
jgi:hypothetical protein